MRANLGQRNAPVQLAKQLSIKRTNLETSHYARGEDTWSLLLMLLYGSWPVTSSNSTIPNA